MTCFPVMKWVVDERTMSDRDLFFFFGSLNATQEDVPEVAGFVIEDDSECWYMLVLDILVSATAGYDILTEWMSELESESERVFCFFFGQGKWGLARSFLSQIMKVFVFWQ